MKALLLVLALFSLPAWGRQPACWPSTVLGSGSPAVAGSTANGLYLGWWCPILWGSVYEYALVLPGETLRHPATLPLTPTGILAAYWEANVIFDGADPKYDAIWNDLVGPLNAIKPLNPVWKVAPNSTYTTRPVYRVVDGALVADPQRATVGADCDCKTLSLVKSTSVYCQPAPLVGVVSLCRK